MGCGQSAPASAPVEIAGTQAIPVATKEPTPVSEATAPTVSNPPTLEAVATMPTLEPARTPSKLPEHVTIEHVQAFRAETPEPVRPLPPSSLPPVKAAAAAASASGRGRVNDVSEVDRMLELNNSNSQGLLLGEEVTTPRPKEQAGPSTATAVERFTGSASPSHSSQRSTRGEEQGRAAAAPQAQDDDPWASLQAQYKIGQEGAGKGSKRAGGRRRGDGGGDSDDDESVEMLDDPGASSKGGNLAAASGVARGASKAVLPPVKLSTVAPGGQPRAGGWGNGELAAAGTLMLDDEEVGMSSLRSRPAAAQVQASAPSEDDGMMLEAGGAVGGAGDLGVEDIEDVDAMIEAEMAASGMNKDLASKLAKFEAMNDDD